MIDEKRGQLVSYLLSGTKNGNLRWTQTTDDKMFLVAFPDSTVTVAALNSLRSPGGATVEVQVANETGRIVDTFINGGVQTHAEESGVYVIVPSLGRQMEELYREARASALEPDKVVDTLLDRLKQLA